MKAQISALDALVAVLLFASVYSIISTSLFNTPTQRDDFDILTTRAKLLASNLLTSTGEPFNWTASNVAQIGLVIDRGVIESDKLAYFLNLSTTNSTTVLQLLGIPSHRFYFNVSYLNSTSITLANAVYNGPAVIGSDFNTSPAVFTRAVAVYNGSRVFVNIKIGT